MNHTNMVAMRFLVIIEIKTINFARISQFYCYHSDSVPFRPCYSCTLIFIVAVSFLCYTDSDRCIFWPSCETVLNGEMCKYVFDAIQKNELKA